MTDESTNDQPSPLEEAMGQAVDAFVYAPIGLLFDGPALFPKLVQQGKQQVQVARMMGEMGVQVGQKELRRRAQQHQDTAVEWLSGLGLLDGFETPDEAPPSEASPAAKPAATKQKPPAKKSAAKKPPVKKTVSKKAPAKKAPAKKPTAKATAQKTVSRLAIPDYDSLSASHVVKRLRGLAPAELDAVKAYEAANRSRKTVLNRIAQLQKD